MDRVRPRRDEQARHRLRAEHRVEEDPFGPRAKYYPGAEMLHVRLVHGAGGRLLGAQLVGREGASKRVDVVAAALHAGLGVHDLAGFDLAYAPPYSPVYDPLLIAAQAAERTMERV